MKVLVIVFRNAAHEHIEIPKLRTAGQFIERAVVNQGYFYLKDGKKFPFIDGFGKPYCGLLDWDGSPLPQGKPVVFVWFAVKSR